MQTSNFIFESYHIDLLRKELIFCYSIQQGNERIAFTEKLVLPREVVRDLPQALLDRVVQQLHLILGISYWKLFCSPKIEVKTAQLNEVQAAFWNKLYIKGLGEFFYRNALDYRGLINFPVTDSISNPFLLKQSNQSLVGVGGGKDSLVTIEMMKKSNKKFDGYAVLKQDSKVIEDSISVAHISSLRVHRIMDPQLAQLNNRKDTYNGHVPVSSIYAFVGILLAILYDYRYVIASNELSASYGNVVFLGETVNHQWSKSLEFEDLFQTYVRDFITPDIVYFSLLRPWYEIKIAEQFSHYPNYFNSFSSCNRNFSSKSPNPHPRRWCGECPKCAFVFALLAAFLNQKSLYAIFGENLFEKKALVPVYRMLLGIEGIKPFECVGTPEETQVAFYLAHQKKEHENSLAMKMFVTECLPQIPDIESISKTVFEKGADARIPEEFKNI